MSAGPSTSALLTRLHDLRAHCEPEATREKEALLAQLAHRPIRDTTRLLELHALLCFLCAFPDSVGVQQTARAGLDQFARRVTRLPASSRRRLDDSGIAGTRVRHIYGLDNVLWLCERFPADVVIDWRALAEPELLDPLLWHIVSLSETQTLDDGEISTQAWVRLAGRGAGVSELTWLLRECRRSGIELTALRQIYDGAEVPVVWSLHDGCASKTRNRLPRVTAELRTAMRRLSEPAAEHIARPLHGIVRLDRRRALAARDVVHAAMLARTREVHAMSHANLDEVYLAPLGAGVQLVALGVQPHERLALEANYGYMIFANGMPLGYGGFTPLFRQVNTGVNIFEEYRGSEASFLYAQVLRLVHSLFGCTHFVVNPYQFGEDNDEALDSGAFWFYYRLGFRPVDPRVRALAKAEDERVRAGRHSAIGTLTHLASCDMHLALPGAHADELFAEAWLGRLARAAMEAIAALAADNRRSALRRLAAQLLERLRLPPDRNWSQSEREALYGLAPTLMQIPDLERWPARDRRDLLALVRAKGACMERDFAVRMARHDRLRRALAAAADKLGRPRN